MEVPTISQKQQKKVLSARKPKRDTIKNVLVTPHAKYLPLLSSEDNNLLQEVLEECLPRVRNEKIKVPWNVLKQVPKFEREAFRLSYSKEKPPDINKADRIGLEFGINDVSSLQERREAGSVLVAGDVEPRLLVQHLIDQAVLYSVPVLVVANLRPILRQYCGISSAAIGLSRNVRPDSKLGLIQQSINTIFKNYPVPENHINYQRRLQYQNDATQSELGSDQTVIQIASSPEVLQVDVDKATNSISSSEMSDQAVIQIPSSPEEPRVVVDEAMNSISLSEVSKSNSDPAVIQIPSGSEEPRAAVDEAANLISSSEVPQPEVQLKYHLRRESQNKRAFVPPGSSDSGGGAKERRVEIVNEFVLLPDPRPVEVANNTQTNYRSLVVKRLKGDKNRERRKMKNFKQKN